MEARGPLEEPGQQGGSLELLGRLPDNIHTRTVLKTPVSTPQLSVTKSGEARDRSPGAQQLLPPQLEAVGSCNPTSGDRPPLEGT